MAKQSFGDTCIPKYNLGTRRRWRQTAAIEEYEELLQDLDDLTVIARRKKEPTIPLAEVKRNKGGTDCIVSRLR